MGQGAAQGGDPRLGAEPRSGGGEGPGRAGGGTGGGTRFPPTTTGAGRPGDG